MHRLLKERAGFNPVTAVIPDSHDYTGSHYYYVVYCIQMTICVYITCFVLLKQNHTTLTQNNDFKKLFLNEILSTLDNRPFINFVHYFFLNKDLKSNYLITISTIKRIQLFYSTLDAVQEIDLTLSFC